MTEISSKSFAFIVGEEVIGTIHIPNTSPNYERLWAGLSSDPIVVECTSTPDVKFGWGWNGNSFVSPGE